MMQDPSNASVQSSLYKLLLCNRIRELADYPEPVTVTDLSRTHKLMVGLVRLAYGLGGLSRQRISRWRCILIYPFVIVLLRLLLYSRDIWRAIPGTIRVVYRKTRFHQPLASEITGYVTCTDKEVPLIRVCLLLRAMRRYGVCIEFLIQRFNSGLPAAQTRQWLSFFLREIGDTEAANIIFPPIGHREATDSVRGLNAQEHLSSAGSKSPRLKYGIVMLTMFDSDVFRSSLLSLLNSDFRGEIIVVEEGNQPERVCEPFCKRLLVRYVKNPRWTGGSGATNLGIEQLGPDTDIVIYAHSDVLWPPHWFGQLNNAWERVYDLGKVAMINLGYMQFDRRQTDAALYDLFVRGRYEDLIWVLRAMRDVQPLMVHVQDVQIKDMGRLFGLARCAWHDRIAELHIMTGRFSVGASFPLQTWRSLGGFDPDMSVGMDLELQYYGFQNRKWNLWVNNTPLVHMNSIDTHTLTGDDKTRFLQQITETYEVFPKKYGWEIEHFLCTYFAETSIIYHDEIVNAANELRFSDIDFVFDDFFERLERKTLASCEIVWCRSRATCKYL